MSVGSCKITENANFWKTPPGAILSFAGSFTGAWNVIHGLKLLKDSEYKKSASKLTMGFCKLALTAFAIYQFSQLITQSNQKVEPTINLTLKDYHDLHRSCSLTRATVFGLCKEKTDAFCTKDLVEITEADIKFNDFLRLWSTFSLCKDSTIKGCQTSVQLICNQASDILSRCSKDESGLKMDFCPHMEKIKDYCTNVYKG